MDRKPVNGLTVFLNGLCLVLWSIYAVSAFDFFYDPIFSLLRAVTALLWGIIFVRSVLRLRGAGRGR